MVLFTGVPERDGIRCDSGRRGSLIDRRLGPPFHARQDAEHFKKEIGCGERGVARGVIGRRDFNEIAAHQIQPPATADDFQRLNCGQSADFRRAGSWREGGVEAVDIEAQIDGAGAHLLAHFHHEWGERFVPAFLGLHDAEALLARPVEIVGRIARAAQADLDASLGIKDPVLNGAAERCAMGNGFAKHGLIDIGMGIDMDEAHGAVLPGDGAEDGIGDGVIAAQRQRFAIFAENGVVGISDDVHAFRQIECINRHIADIGHHETVIGRGAGCHVVGADQTGLGPDLTRPMTCTGAI